MNDELWMMNWNVCNEIKNVLTFGTFDLLHPWHEYYLNEAKKLGDFLVSVVARDQNVFKCKGRLPQNNETMRVQNLQKLWIADKVVLWDLKNPYAVLDAYLPKFICFGYDQKSFNSWVSKYLDQIWLDAKLVTIWSFRPDVFKSSKLMMK